MVPNIIKCVFGLFLTIHFINAKNVNFTLEEIEEKLQQAAIHNIKEKVENDFRRFEEVLSPKYIIQDENIIIEQPILNATILVTDESLKIIKENDDDDDNEDDERHNRTIRLEKRQNNRRARVHNIARRPKMNKAAAAHYLLNMQNFGDRKRRETDNAGSSVEKRQVSARKARGHFRLNKRIKHKSLNNQAASAYYLLNMQHGNSGSYGNSRKRRQVDNNDIFNSFSNVARQGSNSPSYDYNYNQQQAPMTQYNYQQPAHDYLAQPQMQQYNYQQPPAADYYAQPLQQQQPPAADYYAQPLQQQQPPATDYYAQPLQQQQPPAADYYAQPLQQQQPPAAQYNYQQPIVQQPAQDYYAQPLQQQQPHVQYTYSQPIEQPVQQYYYYYDQYGNLVYVPYSQPQTQPQTEQPPVQQPYNQPPVQQPYNQPPVQPQTTEYPQYVDNTPSTTVSFFQPQTTTSPTYTTVPLITTTTVSLSTLTKTTTVPVVTTTTAPQRPKVFVNKIQTNEKPLQPLTGNFIATQKPVTYADYIFVDDDELTSIVYGTPLTTTKTLATTTSTTTTEVFKEQPIVTIPSGRAKDIKNGLYSQPQISLPPGQIVTFKNQYVSEPETTSAPSSNLSQRQQMIVTGTTTEKPTTTTEKPTTTTRKMSTKVSNSGGGYGGGRPASKKKDGLIVTSSTTTTIATTTTYDDGIIINYSPIFKPPKSNPYIIKVKNTYYSQPDVEKEEGKILNTSQEPTIVEVKVVTKPSIIVNNPPPFASERKKQLIAQKENGQLTIVDVRPQRIKSISKIPSTKCPSGYAEPIYEGERPTEMFCRCEDGGYGFDCKEDFENPCSPGVQFSPADPRISNQYFIHCSNGYPYVKKCSGIDLIWDQNLGTCVVPDARYEPVEATTFV